MTTTELAEALESLIDKTSIEQVLGELQEVCYQKQAHIAEAWQDDETAKWWKAIAESLNRACRVAKIG